jgi:DNA repair protein RecO (recombination protein O)
MEDWRDEAIVLAARPFGETGAVVQILAREKGRHAGLLHGAASRKNRPLTEPGTLVDAQWRARLSEQLGSFTLEPMQMNAGFLLDDPLALAALQSAAGLCAAVLPEREPVPGVYDGLLALIETLRMPEAWPVTAGAAYVFWEARLLAALGFGMALDECAATGAREDLAYVSPKTGRAVSAGAGEAYKDKLLRLPGFLAGRLGGTGAPEILDGLALTGYFLARHVLEPAGKPMPEARSRFVSRYERLNSDE